MTSTLHVILDDAAMVGNWAAAHTQYAAQPCVDRPDGAVVATATPQAWKRRPVRILDLSP